MPASALATELSLPLVTIPIDALISEYTGEAATKTTYFAFTNQFSSKERPGGVVRRTENEQGEYDEAFTRKLGWERTPLLYSFEHGNRDSVFYEIPKEEADRIVERIRRSVTGAP